MSQKNEVKRWMSSHPGPTRDMQEVVFAKDYDSLKADLETMNKNCISLSLHDSRMNAIERERDSLKEENDRLKKLNKLLNDIIEATPCDPDITTEQDVAWEEYRKALAGGQDVSKD